MNQSPVNKGKNLLDVQANNRALILTLLKHKQVCSRSELAEASGLKNATITHIVNELISCGLVREEGNMTGKKGRRSVAVALNSDQYAVVSIVISRLFAVVCFYDLGGRRIESELVSFKGMEKAVSFIQKTAVSAEQMIQRHQEHRTLAICIGVPGPYCRETGKSTYIMGYPEWSDFSVQEEFKKIFSIPVIVEHDANLGALAEWECRMEELQEDTFVYIAFSQGIGAGIVQGGQIFRGGFGTAGEIGHISVDYEGEKCVCGNRGCATIQASTIRLSELVKKRLQAGEESVLQDDFGFRELVEAIKQKDTVAYSEYRKILPYLGRTVINAIWAYSPKEIAIGAEMAWIGEMLITDLTKYVKEHMDSFIADKVNIQLGRRESYETVDGGALLATAYIFHHMELFVKE